MAKLITITSTQSVVVTPDLKIRDLSDKSNSVNPNKLRAVVDWNDEPVKILYGIHQYDAKIKDWKTVKALEAGKILTISDVVEVKEVNEPKKEDKKTNKIKLDVE